MEKSPGENDTNTSDYSPGHLLESLHSSSTVSGYTHTFYRYPARFSPQFVHAVIRRLTKPGDTVMDPFMGSGTTAVEALALGRKFFGCDLNPLATFISRVKTTALSERKIAGVLDWAKSLEAVVNLTARQEPQIAWAGYHRNLPWWLRKTLTIALESISIFESKQQREFARCSLLKTAQWALDCRGVIPTKQEFLVAHRDHVEQMVEGCRSLSSVASAALNVPPSRITKSRLILTRSAAGLERDARLRKDLLPPRLVLTSPPYPGVHILYHRWQVQGRRETPAPYWLAGCRDGNGAAHYTFGGRQSKTMDIYLRQLVSCFQSIASLIDTHALVVQLVAFSNPEAQLPLYLKSMRAAGFVEEQMKELHGSEEYIWREVPNRKWYTNLRDRTSSSKELLLVHSKQPV